MSDEQKPKSKCNCESADCNTPKELRALCFMLTELFETMPDPDHTPDNSAKWNEFRRLLWQFALIASAQIDNDPDDTIAKFVEEVERMANIERKRRGLPTSSGVQVVRVSVDSAISDKILRGWDPQNATKH